MSSAQLQGVDLRRARVEVILAQDGHNMLRRVPTLRGADLSGALLTGISLAPEADLEGAQIDCPIRDERCARDSGEWDEWVKECRERRPGFEAGDCPTYSQCESTYRQLKLNFQQSGDYQRAGQFFVREMECRRFQLAQEPWLTGFAALWQKLFRPREWSAKSAWAWLNRSLARGFWCISYYISEHGENPARLAKVMIAVIFVFAWLLGWQGIENGEHDMLVKGLGPPAWEPSRKALYFSTVTFTSLGYGDMSPSGAWGQTLAGIEAGLGLVLMSLLLVCIVRKFSR